MINKNSPGYKSSFVNVKKFSVSKDEELVLGLIFGVLFALFAILAIDFFICALCGFRNVADRRTAINDNNPNGNNNRVNYHNKFCNFLSSFCITNAIAFYYLVNFADEVQFEYVITHHHSASKDLGNIRN